MHDIIYKTWTLPYLMNISKTQKGPWVQCGFAAKMDPIIDQTFNTRHEKVRGCIFTRCSRHGPFN